MKKLIVFICFLFACLCGFAKNDFLLTPNQEYSGDTVIISNTSACSGVTKTLPVPSFLGFQSSCSYSCNGINYHTNQPYIVLTFDVSNDTVFVCYIDSINGESLTTTMAISISVSRASSISIPTDSIKHVTCPNGDFYPYADGAFSVVLDEPTQNYSWIDVECDSSFFFVHTYYDDFTLTGLRSGTYRVVTHGANGCICTDSVTIEQPDPWDFAFYTCRSDTVCHDSTGCLCIDVIGGTPPYNYTWFYLEMIDNEIDTVFLEQAADYVCGLYSGIFYRVYMRDSRGCKAFGEEIEFIATYLYEYVEDTTHLITTNPIACYGSPFLVQAQSMGYGNYIWHVGDSIDSLNYWTWVAADSVLIADFYTPPMTEPTFVSVDFYDQHGCVTHDSVWVDIYNSNISMTIQTQEIIADSMYTLQVSPSGGNLYLDDNLIASNIPSSYTFSTAGISAGEHVLKYAGVFGSEVGLYCEDEVSITIQVQVQPFVTVWNQKISIYPNPATTVLNLSSTEMMDFSISITDITGRVISTERVLDSSHVIDVSNLTPGIYLLHLETPVGATKSIKFIKH